MKKSPKTLLYGLTALFTALLVIFTLGCSNPTGGGGDGGSPGGDEPITISGVIAGDDGVTLSGATVQLKQDGSPVGDPVDAGPGGAYSIPDVEAGTGFTIEASIAGYKTGETASFNVSSALSRNLTLLKFYTVSGTIKESGTGVGNGSVQLIGEDGSPAGNAVPINSDGTYTINEVTSGTYTIQGSSTGTETGAGIFFTVPSDTLTQDLDLISGSSSNYTLRGKIIKADGGLVNSDPASVQLKQSGSGSEVGSPVTADSGVYTITGVGAGTYTIEASLEGYDTAVSASFILPEGLLIHDLTLNSATGFTVSGAITKSDGGNASGASVQLKQGETLVGTPVVTDGSGNYTIEEVNAGTYTIEASLTGYRKGELSNVFVGSNVSNQDIELKKVYTVSGVITKSDGGGADGASVQLKQGTASIGDPVIADGSGAYTIEDVLPGDNFTVEASLTGYNTGGTHSFSVISGDVTGQTLELSKITLGGSHRYTLRGIVTKSDGGGANSNRATVVLKQSGINVEGKEVTVETNGEYVIDHVPGGDNYTLVVVLSGYSEGVTSSFNLPGPLTHNITINPGEGYSITGKITGDVGGNLKEASVQLKQDATVKGTATTGEDGSYTISGVTAGTYTIYASMAGYTPGESGAFLVYATVTDKDLELVKIRYDVSGVISASDGDFAEGASVQLKQGATDVESPVSAGADGTYTIPGVLPGTYTIQVSLAGYQEGTITSFEVSGATAGKNLTLQKYYALNGVISKSDGGYAEGASVQLRQEGNVGGPVIADEDGAYTIPNVIPGTYTIQVTLAGYDPGTINSFTVPAVTTGNLTLEKTKYNVIGVISKANGGFAEGASVQLKLTGANEGNAEIAGSNGAYTIQNVYAGTYTIEASLTDYVTNESGEFTVPAVTTQNLTLQQTKYTVSGVISKGEGGFAEGASVQLKQGASNAGAPVSADPSGAYTISDVTAGTYTIAVTLAGYQAGTSTSFTVTGVNSTGINLTLEKLKSISGVITKSDGGNAAGASVQLKLGGSNAGGEVIADAGGAYTIPDVSGGTYSIEVYLFGYQLGTDDFTVSTVDVTKNLTLTKKTVDSSLTGTAVSYSEAAFEPLDFTEALAAEAYTATAANLEGVIPIRWSKVSGAQSYTVYYDRARKFSNAIPNPNSGDGFYYYPDAIPSNSIAIAPSLPARTAEVVSGITDNFYFARHLDGETTYFFWIQPVSASGEGPAGGAFTKYLKEKGRQNGNVGVERADYPKGVNAIPGDQNILVTWNNSDRAVWYEVFYYPGNLTWTQLGESGTDNLKPYKKIALQTSQNAIPWNQAWDDSTGALGSAGTTGGSTAYPIYRFDATITGLTNGTNYYIWVRSLNANGERGLTRVGPITPSVPLAAVPGLNATPAQRQLDLSWNALSGAGKYGIFWSTSSNTPVVTDYHVETTGTTYSLKGLDAETTYYVWVIGYNGTGNVIPGAFGSPVLGTTPSAPPGVVDNTKLDKNGHKVENFLYVEVNDNDPRVAMGYVMEQTGKQFFDYVVIFAANLRTRDCEAEYLAGGANHICTQKGPHLHYNGNTQHILDNRDIYIKPLQDRGIKVLLGLLGDHDPIGMGTFQASPHSNFPQCDIPAREALAAQIAGEVNRYGLDGVDFDDEWTKNVNGTAAYSGSAANGNTGPNMLNFIINVRRLMPEKTISVFDYHMAKNIPSSVTVWQKDGLYYTEDPGEAGSSVSKTSHDFFDILTESIYGSWVASASAASAPNSKYAPVAINVDTMNPSWNNISTYTGTGSSYFMSSSKSGSASNWYGFNMWYALRDRAWYQNSGTWGKASTVRTIEGYLSRASNNIYGENVIYVGVDYPQNWSKW